MSIAQPFLNPFRPGAGHPPPYLAGRDSEIAEFRRLLTQSTILENLVLTGLRGVGKTVLLDTFKPLAIQEKWAWVGTDLSESASLSEEKIVLRLLADLSVHTAALPISSRTVKSIGFGQASSQVSINLDYNVLDSIYRSTPGLPSDKLKRAVTLATEAVMASGLRGIVFAYDEAQNLADHTEKEQFPLSLLLDVFQSLQKQGLPAMLVLTGLPTLFPKLVEARTFAERMFHVALLDRLSQEDSRKAIEKPIAEANCPVKMDDASIKGIVNLSGGYPYFIQFICREVYDVFLQGQTAVPVSEITRKLDTDFFAGRWARATDRQRELMMVISNLDGADGEFTVQEISEKSQEMKTTGVMEKPFNASNINQMLAKLSDDGLIYKNRHGRYSFAVPLLNRFIQRQAQDALPPSSTSPKKK